MRKARLGLAAALGVTMVLVACAGSGFGQYGYYKTKEQAEAARDSVGPQVQTYQQRAVWYMDRRDQVEAYYATRKPYMTPENIQQADLFLGYAHVKRTEAADKYTESANRFTAGTSAFNQGNWTQAYNEFTSAYGHVTTGINLLGEAIEMLGYAESWMRP